MLFLPVINLISAIPILAVFFIRAQGCFLRAGSACAGEELLHFTKSSKRGHGTAPGYQALGAFTGPTVSLCVDRALVCAYFTALIPDFNFLLKKALLLEHQQLEQL